MRMNMGTADRIIRAVVVAPALLIVAAMMGFTAALGIIATVLAVVMLGTAAVGTCPLYLPFHADTRHSGSGEQPA